MANKMEEARGKIEQLEMAVQHLDVVRRHLSVSATEIKSQIHSAISRNLEAMRNREVWLLGQVDLVTSAKESVLQQQQARLNKCVGVLHSTLALASHDSSMETQIAETLERLELGDLKPEETPYISFRADQTALREAIMSFGRVDAKGMPLQTAFVEEGTTSASLPRHLEEYEDAEHHVFYKTVEEIRRTRSDSGSIYVNIPKLSTHSEDWLLRPTTMTTATESAPRFSFPAFSTRVNDWVPPTARKQKAETELSPLPCLSNDASIRSWLSQIKQNPDLEDEDDFEIVNHSAPSGSETGDSGSSVPVTPVTLTTAIQSRFNFSSDLEQWVKKAADPSVDRDSEKAVDLFAHIPKDLSVWLKRQDKHVEVGSRSREQPKRASSKDTEKPMTYTNIMAAYQARLPTDPSFWLKSGSKGGNSCKRLEKNEESCANSVSSGNLSPIVSEDHTWLLTHPCVRFDPKNPIDMSQFLLSLETDKDRWLKKGGSTKPMGPEIVHKFEFFQSMSNRVSDWLQESQPRGGKTGWNLTSGDFQFKHSPEDCKMWLKDAPAASSSTPSSPCPAIKKFTKMYAETSLSDWLHHPRGNELEQEGRENGSEEGWLLCKMKPSEVVGQEKVSTNLMEWLFSQSL